jgi:HSP20 family protein
LKITGRKVFDVYKDVCPPPPIIFFEVNYNILRICKSVYARLQKDAPTPYSDIKNGFRWDSKSKRQLTTISYSRCIMAKEEEKKDTVKAESPPLMPFRDLEKWFEDIFPRPFAPFSFPRFRVAAEEIMPDVDIFQTDKDVVLKAELPGMKKEDIEVTLAADTITISGKKKKEDEVKKKDYHKYERSYGSFCRTFTLPAEVKADKVKSTFKDGVLEVIMPKSEEAKSKEVKIKIE